MEDFQPTQPAENPVAVEDNSAPVSPAEQPTTSAETPVESPAESEPQAPEAPATETPVEAEHQPARPAERRIRQQASEIKRLTQENSRLLSQVPSTSPQNNQKLSEMLAGRESIDPTELDNLGDQFVAQKSQAAASLEVSKLRFELEQKEAVSQYDADRRKIDKLYKDEGVELTPEIEQEIVDDWTERAIKTNPFNNKIQTIDPGVRLLGVAERFLRVAKAAGAHGQQQASADLAKNVDSAAVTPNASAPEPDLPFEQLSKEEMKKRLRAKGVATL